MTDRHGIGANNPPAFDAFSMALEDVRLEAGNFLDGSPLETQEQANALGVIVSTAKKIRKDADAARAEEKRPHDEAASAVQSKWKPLLAQADAIASASQAPLTAWLHKQEAEQREAARLARVEAERVQAEALAAERAAAGNIEATERARELAKDADKAVRLANRADKAKAHVAGADRAIGLRARQVATVTDYRALLDWIVENDRPALEQFMDHYADKSLPARLPGVEVSTERKVA
jgi:hypothetical protein